MVVKVEDVCFYSRYAFICVIRKLSWGIFVIMSKFSLRDGVDVAAAGLKSIWVRGRGQAPLPILDEL